MNFSKILILVGILTFSRMNAQHEAATEATSTSVKTTLENELEEVDAKLENAEEKYNPKPDIMHHIKDSHTWDILGLAEVNLPCIIWSSATGVSTFLYEEGKIENGYKCEHGQIEREDGAFFLDMSLTKNVLGMILGALILFYIFFAVAKAYSTTNKGKAPKGLQSLIEPLVVFVRDDIAKPGIGKDYERFLPYIMTIFFFILINNLIGLVPLFGVNITGNIAVTMVLAILTMLVINFSANKYYWKHIFAPDVPIFLYPIIVPVEILGILTKPMSLMIRLFANMTAGHIIVLSLISLIFVFGNAGKSLTGTGLGTLVAVPFTLFISCIEVMVAFIQAFIFATLSSVFIGMAVEEHH